MSSSYHSKVRDLLKTRQSCFSFVWAMDVLFSHIWVKPKFLLLTLTWQTLSTLTFSWKQMNYVFLTRFSYTLFTKTLLLFHISLLKRFIYRRVNTSKILRGATIPIMLTKNQVKTVSVHFVKKKLPSCQVIYYLPIRKIQSKEKSCWFRIFHMLIEKMLLPVAYVTEWTLIDL